MLSANQAYTIINEVMKTLNLDRKARNECAETSKDYVFVVVPTDADPRDRFVDSLMSVNKQSGEIDDYPFRLHVKDLKGAKKHTGLTEVEISD